MNAGGGEEGQRVGQSDLRAQQLASRADQPTQALAERRWLRQKAAGHSGSSLASSSTGLRLGLSLVLQLDVFEVERREERKREVLFDRQAGKKRGRSRGGTARQKVSAMRSEPVTGQAS